MTTKVEKMKEGCRLRRLDSQSYLGSTRSLESKATNRRRIVDRGDFYCQLDTARDRGLIQGWAAGNRS